MLAAWLELNWGTPFILFGIYGIIRYFAKGDSKDKNTVNWSVLESIGVTVAIYFVSQLVGALLVYSVPLLFGQSPQQISDWLDGNPYGQFFFVLAVEALTVGLLYYFVKRRGASFKTIGLKTPRWRDLAYVLLGFVIYFAAYVLIVAVVKQIVPSLDTDQPQQLGFDNVNDGHLPIVFISLVLLPPFVEELITRGFLYSGLRKGLPVIWAAIITSVLFAVAHLQPGSSAPLLWTAAIDTFVLSLVLIYLKEKTGSLVASIGLHMLKNGIAFVVLFVLR